VLCRHELMEQRFAGFLDLQVIAEDEQDLRASARVQISQNGF
jgi:hypothetical protein